MNPSRPSHIPDWLWEAFVWCIAAVLAITQVRKLTVWWMQFAEWAKRPRGMQLAILGLTEASRMNTESNKLQTEAIKGINGTLGDIRDSMMNLVDQQSIQGAANRIIFSESQVARWVCDANGHCVQTNTALEHLFGLTSEAMMERGWIDAVIPEHRARVVAEFNRLYAQPDDYNYETNYTIRRNGHYVNVTAKSVEVVRSVKDGKVITVFGTCEPTPLIREHVHAASNS